MSMRGNNLMKMFWYVNAWIDLFRHPLCFGELMKKAPISNTLILKEFRIWLHFRRIFKIGWINISLYLKKSSFYKKKYFFDCNKKKNTSNIERRYVWKDSFHIIPDPKSHLNLLKSLGLSYYQCLNFAPNF